MIYGKRMKKVEFIMMKAYNDMAPFLKIFWHRPPEMITFQRYFTVMVTQL